MAALFRKSKKEQAKNEPTETDKVKSETTDMENAETASEEGSEQSGKADEKPARQGINVLNQLVGSLGKALDGDIEQIDRSSEDEENRGKAERHHGYFVFGAITLFFSLIGIIASAGLIKDIAVDVYERRALKQEFTQFLYPVVITDPPEFESTDNLLQNTIIASAVWKIILFGDTNNYEKDMGMMTIPAIDVEASVRSIFGNSVPINHHSIDDIEYLFDYSPETNSYVVPENPRHMTYAPKIAELTNEGEVFKATVDYMPPNLLAGIDGVIAEDEPIKTLIYTIRRTKDGMAIQSVMFAFSEAMLVN